MAVLALALLNSCTDKDTVPIDTTTYHPSSVSSFPMSLGQAESMSHDLLITALNFAGDTSLWNIGGFPIVTATSDTSYPRTITIDFGTADTTTLLHTAIGDMRTRSGILSITLTDDWHKSGSNITITATSLRLSGMMTCNGVIEFANRGKHNYLTKQCPFFDFVTNNIIFSKKDGRSFRYSANKIYHMTSGDTTATIYDDVFYISGTSTATQDTNFLSLSISGHYYAPHSCFWFKEGSATISEDKINRTLSFNNTNCSPMANLILVIEGYNDTDVVYSNRYIDLP